MIPTNGTGWETGNKLTVYLSAGMSGSITHCQKASGGCFREVPSESERACCEAKSGVSPLFTFGSCSCLFYPIKLLIQVHFHISEKQLLFKRYGIPFSNVWSATLFWNKKRTVHLRLKSHWWYSDKNDMRFNQRLFQFFWFSFRYIFFCHFCHIAFIYGVSHRLFYHGSTIYFSYFLLFCH